MKYSFFKWIKLLSVLLCCKNLSAETPAVQDIISLTTHAWDRLTNYDATYCCQFPLRHTTNYYREVWTKSSGDMLYRFETLNPSDKNRIENLVIRNLSGEWEIQSNNYFSRAINLEFKQEKPSVYVSDFKVPTNQGFESVVKQCDLGGILCYVVCSLKASDSWELGAPLKMNYFISKQNYMVYSVTGTDMDGKTRLMEVISSLKYNSALDISLFSIPASLGKVIVTNSNEYAQMLVRDFKSDAQSKNYFAFPGKTSIRIPIKLIILASLCFVNVFFIPFILKHKR